MRIAQNQEEKRQKLQNCQFYFAGDAAGAAAAGAVAAGAAAAGAGVAAAGTASAGAVAGAVGAADGMAAEPCTGAGAVTLSITPAPAEMLPLLAMTDRLRVAAKKIAAASAVDLDRKFEEPDAPNRLPEAPEPKAAPMSAPLPCCNNTRAMMATADRTCTTMTRLNKEFMLFHSTIK